MSTDGATGAGPFRAAYLSALEHYLGDPSEGSLRVAYELGREAVSRQMSVLDLAVAHHEALTSALIGGLDPEEMRQVTQAAVDFFSRAFHLRDGPALAREARDAALLERRQTEMSRSAVGLLGGRLARSRRLRLARGDAAARGEQARELVDAGCCLATWLIEGRVAASRGPPTRTRPTWTAFVGGSTCPPSTG